MKANNVFEFSGHTRETIKSAHSIIDITGGKLKAIEHCDNKVFGNMHTIKSLRFYDPNIIRDCESEIERYLTIKSYLQIL